MPGPLRHGRRLPGLQQRGDAAADPRYRSDTIVGLPATHAISRRYQYGFPLITFLYKLTTL
jgi:hypothetical protein